MLTIRGIEANPDKCRAMMEMRSPANVKEVQRLAERVTSLQRFLPRSADKAYPFFRVLKRPSEFKWTDECEKAFLDLKEFLTTPPVLITPQPGRELFLYLSVSEQALSAVLVQELEKKQQPIYYISRVLQEAETRYQMIEKLALALVTAARRLRLYFQSHQITVRTDYPIRQVLRKPKLAGQTIAWSVELSEFGLIYKPQGPIKAQCLSDFVAKLSQSKDVVTKEGVWKLYVDGSSNVKGSGTGIILEGPDDISLEQSVRLDFLASNDQAKYEAILAGMNLALELGVKRLKAFSDSQLVTSQVSGEYQAKDPQLTRYLPKSIK